MYLYCKHTRMPVWRKNICVVFTHIIAFFLVLSHPYPIHYFFVGRKYYYWFIVFFCKGNAFSIVPCESLQDTTDHSLLHCRNKGLKMYRNVYPANVLQGPLEQPSSSPQEGGILHHETDREKKHKTQNNYKTSYYFFSSVGCDDSWHFSSWSFSTTTAASLKPHALGVDFPVQAAIL